MKTPSLTLYQLQNLVQQALLQQNKTSHIIEQIEEVSPLLAQQRLSIYQKGYITRLTRVMASDFPVVKQILGTEEFYQLVSEYITQQPSTSYSVSHLGESFAEFIFAKLINPGSLHAAIFDLAHLEWSLKKAFFAPPTPRWTQEELQAIVTSAPESIQLRLAPSVQFFTSSWSLVRIYQQEQLLTEPEETHIVIYQRNGIGKFRKLSPLELRLLEQVGKNKSMQDFLNYAQQQQAIIQQPSLLQSYFQKWISQGLIFPSKTTVVAR